MVGVNSETPVPLHMEGLKFVKNHLWQIILRQRDVLPTMKLAIASMVSDANSSTATGIYRSSKPLSNLLYRKDCHYNPRLVFTNYAEDLDNIETWLTDDQDCLCLRRTSR